VVGQAPVLAEAGYKVHLPERRGHAHTPDVEGPLTYEVMAADTVAYLEGVVGGPAHLVGWSDGRWWPCWWRGATRSWWTGWC
jgi:pimeloyl-ACP methyl ester carboxylesterase